MKVELNIPESLKDITLQQYQKFVAIKNLQMTTCYPFF